MHGSLNRPARIPSLQLFNLAGPSSSTSNLDLGGESLNKAITTASNQPNLPSIKSSSLYSDPLWQNHSFSLCQSRQPRLFALVDSINKVAIDLKTTAGPVINSNQVPQIVTRWPYQISTGSCSNCPRDRRNMAGCPKYRNLRDRTAPWRSRL